MVSTKAKRTRPTRAFLETSAIYFDRHGADLMKKAVHEAIDGRVALTSNFIRMEYLRGTVITLIELYFMIKELPSVQAALTEWTQRRSHQPRTLILILQSISKWITDQEQSDSKEASLARLGNLIVRMVHDFDDAYLARSRDELGCELGRVNMPKQEFSENLLFNFHEEFKRIQDGPKCEFCKFKHRILRQLDRRRIAIHSEESRSQMTHNEGFCKQSKRLEQKLAKNYSAASCRICRDLGDTIIALQTPRSTELVTADTAFSAFGEMLGFTVSLLPSLAQLKKQSANG